MSNIESINPEDDLGVASLDEQEGSLIGKTSQESSLSAANDSKNESPSVIKRLFSKINLFDSMLLVSFLLITFSTLYLVYATIYYYQTLRKPFDVDLWLE